MLPPKKRLFSYLDTGDKDLRVKNADTQLPLLLG
jgi:hypothetical protein